jgi:hypothetical protein
LLEKVKKEREGKIKGREKGEKKERNKGKKKWQRVCDQTANQAGKPLKKGEKKITSSGTAGLQA